jgi:hypothetical protein
MEEMMGIPTTSSQMYGHISWHELDIHDVMPGIPTHIELHRLCRSLWITDMDQLGYESRSEFPDPCIHVSRVWISVNWPARRWVGYVTMYFYSISTLMSCSYLYSLCIGQQTVHKDYNHSYEQFAGKGDMWHAMSHHHQRQQWCDNNNDTMMRWWDDEEMEERGQKLAGLVVLPPPGLPRCILGSTQLPTRTDEIPWPTCRTGTMDINHWTMTTQIPRQLILGQWECHWWAMLICQVL